MRALLGLTWAGRGAGHLQGCSCPDPAPRRPRLPPWVLGVPLPPPIRVRPQGPELVPGSSGLGGRREEAGVRAPRPRCAPRSIVYLEIDNRQCVQSSSQCFQSATDVAAFLGALASLGSLNIPYKIEAVQSEWPALLAQPHSLGSFCVYWEGSAGEGLSPSSPPRCSRSSCHLPPTGVSRHPEFRECLLAFSAPHALPPHSDSCQRGWPRGTSTSQKVGAFFSPHPFLLIFLCWVLFQNHYSFFFKKKRREREKN